MHLKVLVLSAALWIARLGLPQPSRLTIGGLHSTKTGSFQTQQEVHFQKGLLNMRPWRHFTRTLTPLGPGPFRRSLCFKFSLEVEVLPPALMHQVACPFAMGAFLGRSCALGRRVSWSCYGRLPGNSPTTGPDGDLFAVSGHHGGDHQRAHHGHPSATPADGWGWANHHAIVGFALVGRTSTSSMSFRIEGPGGEGDASG